MNEDMLFFWTSGTIFGLVMLFVKSTPFWKFLHCIVFLSYFVYAYWEMNGPHPFGFIALIISAFTVLHIVLFLIGVLIFGFIRRQMKKSDAVSKLYQENTGQQNESN